MQRILQEKINEMSLHQSASILDASKTITKSGHGIAFITDRRRRFLSVVGDGDIRRGLLQGRQLDENVMTVANDNPVYVHDTMSPVQILSFLTGGGLKSKPHRGSIRIPVLNKARKIVNVLFVLIKDNDKCVIDCDLHDLERAKKFSQVKSVLITGGAGYLGSILCRKLLADSYKVKVLDNLLYGDEAIKDLYKNPLFEFIKGDIQDLRVVTQSIKGVDAVIHLAAIVGDPASKKFPEKAIGINYLATKGIIEACKYFQVNRFIFASTCSVYGKSGHGNKKLTVKSKLHPLSLYSKMKLESERAILSLADINFSPTIFRMATLYGLSPRMRFDLAVNYLTAEAVSKRKIYIFGGKQWRPFLHVSDAAGAYSKCLKIPYGKISGQIFNLGSDDQNYQIHRLGGIIKKVLPKTKICKSNRKGDERSYRVSFTDTSKLLNFFPQYKVSDGVSEIKTAMKRGKFKDYQSAKYHNVYTRKGLFQQLLGRAK